MKAKMNEKIKVVMKLPRELIGKMRGSINNGDYKDMTSLIESAINNLLENGPQSNDCLLYTSDAADE